MSEPARRWAADAASGLALFAAVAVPILLFGGTAPWGNSFTTLLGCAAGVAVMVRTAASSSPALPWPPLSIAALTLAGLCAAQTVPLPVPLLRFVAPRSAAAWSAIDASRGTISLAPWQTWNEALRWVSLSLLHAGTANWVAAADRSNPGGSSGRIARARAAVTAVAAFGLAIGIAALAERFVGIRVWSRFLSAADQGFGPFPNRNDFAVLAAACLPLLAALLASPIHTLISRARRDQDWGAALRAPEGFAVAIGIAGAILALALVMASESRVTLLAVGGASLALPFLGGRRDSWRARGARFLPALCFAAVLCGALLRGVGPDAHGLAAEWRVRLSVWRHAASLVGASPMLGVGAGAFDATVPDALPDVWGFAFHAENDPLEFVATFGLVGALVVLAGIWGWCRRWAAVVRSSDRRGTLAIGLAGAILAMLVASCGTFVFPIPALAALAFALAGIAAGLHDGESPTRRRSARWVLAAAALTVFVSAGGRFFAGLYWDVVRRADGTQSDASRLALLRRAARLDPGHPGVALELARAAEAEAFTSPAPWNDESQTLSQAAAWYRRRLNSRPTDAYAREALAALRATTERARTPEGAPQ